MTRDVINESVNTMVSQYMRQRATNPNHPRALDYTPSTLDNEDPLDQVLDPIARVGKSILDDLIRNELRFFIQSEVTEMTRTGTVGNDYLLEAFFIPYFNH